MDDLELLIDLHRDGERQGPGSDATTTQVLDLSGLRDGRELAVADLGCGTGASTLVLARELDAHVTAIDLAPAFLERLDAAAAAAGLAERITTRAASIDDLDLEAGSLDAIWSEGAIYNVGFRAGVARWRRLLKPGGVLAVSELTWFTRERPHELDRHWRAEYPEVATASAKLAILEDAGYSPIAYVPLDESCWLDHYYEPLRLRFEAFLDRHDRSAAAEAIVAAERHEIDLYERFSSFVGYGFYVARRLDGPVT